MDAERIIDLETLEANGDYAEPEPIASPIAISLDWDAYFAQFKELHGEPVRFRQKLLFPDGWTYSLKSKEGPEWPPPSDSERLHRLQMSYWLTRLSLVQTEFNTLQDILTNLRSLQRSRSLPLQVVSTVYDEEQGKYRRAALPLNLDEIENGRLAWLHDDIAQCHSKLRELESVHTTSLNGTYP